MGCYTIANAKEPRTHSTAKHSKLRFHVIRQNVDEGEVKICKVDTELNVADPLTKALHQEKHEQHRDSIGVRFLPIVN